MANDFDVQIKWLNGSQIEIQASDASALNGDEKVLIIAGGAAKETTTQDIANLGGGGGGGVTIYTGDGALTGNRTLDLNDFSLHVVYDGINWLNFDLVEHITTIQAWDETQKQAGYIDLYGTDSVGRVRLSTNFNLNDHTGTIDMVSTADDVTVQHTADSHTFNGNVFFSNNVTLNDLAGGGTSGLSIDNDGKIIRGGGVPDTAYASNADAVAALGVGIIYKTTSVGSDGVQPLLSVTIAV